MEDVLDLRRIAECDAPGRVDESLTLLLGEVCQPIAAPVPPERKVASTNVEDDEQIGVHCRSGGYAQGRPQLGISEPRGLGDDFDRQYGRLGSAPMRPRLAVVELIMHSFAQDSFNRLADPFHDTERKGRSMFASEPWRQQRMNASDSHSAH